MGQDDGVQQRVQDFAPLLLQDPILQVVHVAIDPAPVAALEVPATQELHVAIDVAAMILLHCPAIHKVQDVAPIADHDPALQVTHVAFENAPLILLYVPAGQITGLREEKGQ